MVNIDYAIRHGSNVVNLRDISAVSGNEQTAEWAAGPYTSSLVLVKSGNATATVVFRVQGAQPGGAFANISGVAVSFLSANDNVVKTMLVTHAGEGAPRMRVDVTATGASGTFSVDLVQFGDKYVDGSNQSFDV